MVSPVEPTQLRGDALPRWSGDFTRGAGNVGTDGKDVVARGIDSKERSRLRSLVQQAREPASAVGRRGLSDPRVRPGG